MTYKTKFAEKLSCRIAGGLLAALMAASTLTYAQTAAVSSVVPNVLNYNGTLTDTTTNLMWEKKDMAGGVHDVTQTYLWAGECENSNGQFTGYCQPDAPAQHACELLRIC